MGENCQFSKDNDENQFKADLSNAMMSKEEKDKQEERELMEFNRLIQGMTLPEKLLFLTYLYGVYVKEKFST